MLINYRDCLVKSDTLTVREIVESTGFFTRAEIGVAIELVQEHLDKGIASGYFFLLAEDSQDVTLGYTCYGPIPCTKDSFDLYWIAVRPDHQRLGIGKNLLAQTEQSIAQLGGSRIYIETSSRISYTPTREFYLKSGYHNVADLKDFYAPGDNKIIFCKELSLRGSS